jgi:hypothetical protein
MGIIFKNFSPGSDSSGPPSPDPLQRTEPVDHTTAQVSRFEEKILW